MQEEKQTTQVERTTDGAVQRETVRRTDTAPGTIVAKRVIYYIAGVIIALLALRFVFLLLGANQGSPFVDFIYGLSAVFVYPFVGIFGEPQFGQTYFETSSLVAIVIYGLLAVGIGRLMTLGSNRS